MAWVVTTVVTTRPRSTSSRRSHSPWARSARAPPSRDQATGAHHARRAAPHLHRPLSLAAPPAPPPPPPRRRSRAAGPRLRRRPAAWVAGCRAAAPGRPRAARARCRCRRAGRRRGRRRTGGTTARPECGGRRPRAPGRRP
eukprot:4868711-Prymnesium_polylepis.1